MKTIMAYLSSIQFITIMTLLICFCASCKQKDDIAGGLHDPIMETECCEELILYSGGIEFGQPGLGSYDDNYQNPDPDGDQDKPDYRITPRAVPPNTNPVLRLNYDEVPNNNYLVQTFDWSLAGFGLITGAILEFEARPEGGDAINDKIHIYPWHFADNSTGPHAIAGANLGSGPTQNGLVPLWSNSVVGSTVFTIDLTNFPSDKFDRIHGGQRLAPPLITTPLTLSGVPYFVPSNPGDYQLPGGYDLTRLMNKLSRFDVLIGDDTMVDWMKLTLIKCKAE